VNSKESERILQQLASRGWLFMPATLGIDSREILSTLGPLIPSRWGSPYLDLIPYTTASAPPASMSSIVGTDEQPMHTDLAYCALPPKYVVLQCVNPGEVSCPTRVWELNLDRLKTDHPTVLTEVKWMALSSEPTQFYCSILDFRQEEIRVRFDPFCMRPINGRFDIVNDTCRKLAAYSQAFSFNWESGSILVLNNWRCLHARGPGSDKSPSRKLRRWNIGVNHGLVT
jgi:hypothetical protein